MASPLILYIDIYNYIDIGNESICKGIKVFIKFVCRLPFTFYFSVMEVFKFKTKSHFVHGKQRLLKPSPPSLTAIGRFAMTKVGMDAVPYNTRDSLLMWELFMNIKF